MLKMVQRWTILIDVSKDGEKMNNSPNGAERKKLIDVYKDGSEMN
jgi:hypothetical protein